jgi:hypothetical protein
MSEDSGTEADCRETHLCCQRLRSGPYVEHAGILASYKLVFNFSGSLVKPRFQKII